MELNLSEIDDLVNNSEAPTFENTILPMERSGAALDRAFVFYGLWRGSLSSPEFREIQEELAPKISEFSSKITQNKQLFERIKTVYNASQNNPLPADQQR